MTAAASRPAALMPRTHAGGLQKETSALRGGAASRTRPSSGSILSRSGSKTMQVPLLLPWSCGVAVGLIAPCAICCCIPLLNYASYVIVPCCGRCLQFGKVFRQHRDLLFGRLRPLPLPVAAV